MAGLMKTWDKRHSELPSLPVGRKGGLEDDIEGGFGRCRG